MNLLSSLGLESVEADPNHIPDNRYNGIVARSELVVAKNKGTLNHVITYKITEGDRTGAEKAEWFKLGDNAVTAEGNPAEKASEVASYTPSMTEQAKPWYKKRWVDLGVPEDQVGKVDFDVLVGTKVTFGIKTKDGYSNINFVERREATAQEQASVPQSLGGTTESTDNVLGQL